MAVFTTQLREPQVYTPSVEWTSEDIYMQVPYRKSSIKRVYETPGYFISSAIKQWRGCCR